MRNIQSYFLAHIYIHTEVHAHLHENGCVYKHTPTCLHA